MEQISRVCTSVVSIIIINIFFTILSEPKKFVVIIPSYNNSDWYKKNLDSLCTQTYTQWRAIYIDDNSPDGTGELVAAYLENNPLKDKFTLIQNTSRKWALANHWTAIKLCAPHEIIVHLDGDDWLADPSVLEYLNSIYQDPEIWLTYGQFINWPTKVLGYNKPTPAHIIKNNSFRDITWQWSALRTFYACLAHQIREQDLKAAAPPFNGGFITTNADLALFYPLLEMAGTHIKFIKKIIYIRNVATPINDFKVNADTQLLGGKIIRAKKRYKPLKKLPLN